VEIAGATRMCTTVLCSKTGVMTELIDPSATVDPSDVSALHDAVVARMPPLRGLALCGTYPPGVDASLYADLARASGSVTVLVDGYRGVDETLATGAVDILKINCDELRAMTGIIDIPAAAASCLARYSLQWLGLTDGPGRAFLYSPEGGVAFDMPQLDDVANPIGAGDTVSAVFMYGILEGLDGASAFRDALAAASASCRRFTGAEFAVDEMRQIAADIHVERI
jgi:fructose-1-phosphate kinase PfkB-like protein